MFLLDVNQPKSIELYLKEKGWIIAGETVINVCKAGEGNMNYVLRVSTENGGLIIKQSKNYVEKYPHIPAPDTRVINEGLFYKTIFQNKELKDRMPALIGIDEENRILAMQDVGISTDFSFLYHTPEKLTATETEGLLSYLSELHHLPAGEKKITNTDMRALNHEHIFEFPFQPHNGFNLDTVQPGLEQLSQPYKTNEGLKSTINSLGKLYLASGQHLLHGDFYPGSWLKSNGEIKIIDPEFCFHGTKEFDIGVFIAHLLLTDHDMGLIEEILKGRLYKKPFNIILVKAFAGVEVMRRIIGIAQLPMTADIPTKNNLMQYAYDLIMQ